MKRSSALRASYALHFCLPLPLVLRGRRPRRPTRLDFFSSLSLPLYSRRRHIDYFAVVQRWHRAGRGTARLAGVGECSCTIAFSVADYTLIESQLSGMAWRSVAWRGGAWRGIKKFPLRYLLASCAASLSPSLIALRVQRDSCRSPAGGVRSSRSPAGLLL